MRIENGEIYDFPTFDNVAVEHAKELFPFCLKIDQMILVQLIEKNETIIVLKEDLFSEKFENFLDNNKSIIAFELTCKVRFFPEDKTYGPDEMPLIDLFKTILEDLDYDYNDYMSNMFNIITGLYPEFRESLRHGFEPDESPVEKEDVINYINDKYEEIEESIDELFIQLNDNIDELNNDLEQMYTAIALLIHRYGVLGSDEPDMVVEYKDETISIFRTIIGATYQIEKIK